MARGASQRRIFPVSKTHHVQPHFHSLIVGMVAVASIPAQADTVLFYDSTSGGSALGIIASETDASFVTSPSATTTLGTNATFVQQHSGGGLTTVTLGDGADMQFRFAFTDRTSVAGGAQQEATRLGSFDSMSVNGRLFVRLRVAE